MRRSRSGWRGVWRSDITRREGERVENKERKGRSERANELMGQVNVASEYYLTL